MPEQRPITIAAETQALAYSRPARLMHWLTVAAVAVMIPLGLIMKARSDADIWDATTNALYNVHKLVGFLLLLLVIARLAYRLAHGAPADEPTLAPWQRLTSHATHWALYGLLLLVPVIGWIGVSQYGAREIFGLVRLPAIAAGDQDASHTTFEWHAWAAYALIALVALHVAAALFHRLVRKDGVLARMLPPRSR
jgi:cytochrome b561